MIDHRPRDVFCVIEQAHRDLGRAEAVASGWFEIAGRSLELGRSPDWLHADFPVDDEWRIELGKFYYGLDLASAYRQTGRTDFVDCWTELVRSWIAQVPVASDPTDVAARRIQNWTYAWIELDAAGCPRASFDVETSNLILASISAQIDYVRTNLARERNHRTLELYALFVCGLAHPALDTGGELVRFAAFELYRNLLADVLVDGVHRERSTHYHAIALRSFLGTRVNADRFGVELPPGFDDRLLAACDFLADVIRPDGSLPMISDADGGDYRDLLHLAADHLEVPALRWVASAGKQGEPPTQRIRTYDAGGYYLQRSGWGDHDTPYADESQLIFDCGPVGDSGHGHYDALHVEVSAGGRPLLVDPGRFTYSESGDANLRHWFKGTAAHNTVCVDGLDQISYRRGKPKGPVSQVRFLGRDEGQGVVSFLGEVLSPEYDAVHRRRVLFVDDEWWVIEDVLEGHRQHHYDLRFHLGPDAHGRTRIGAGGDVTAPGLHLFLPHDGSEPTIEPGWIAPTYGTRLPAPVVSLVVDAASARFVSLIVPTPDEAPSPELLSWSATHAELRRGTTTQLVTWGARGLEAVRC